MESIRQYGPLAVAAYLFDLVRVHRAERAEGFDRRFGTDTATVVFPWNLPSIGPEHTPEIHLYEATPAWLIREILESIPLQPNMFAFVDMGSGKGRALLVASELPFAKIVGASQLCTAFFLHRMNAIEYTFGPEPLVLFLFNPFGRDSVRSILASLEASLSATPRQAYVVYVNPRFESSARSSHFLRRVRKGGAWWRPWGRYVVYAASVDSIGPSGGDRHLA
jgi:hypothetical protein